MKKWLLNSTLFAVSVATLLYGGSEGKKVQSIVVSSTDKSQSIDQENVLNRLQIKESQLFDQELFDRDLKSLAKDFEDIQPKIIESGGQLQIILNLSPRPVIETISWKGNRKISTSSLEKDLDIKEKSLLNRAKIHEGLSKMRLHYLKSGYFQAQVGYSLEPQDSGKSQLIITIQEGLSGKIGSVNYEGLESRELKKLKKQLILKPHNFFTSWYSGRGQYIEDVLELDRSRIIHYLHDEGFADAKVEARLKDLVPSRKLEIDFKALRGQVYSIKNISYEGFEDLEAKQKLNLLVIRNGDLYSPGRLRDMIKNVSEYYGSKGYADVYVTYEPLLTDPRSPSYDIVVKVQPGPLYRVGMVRFAGNYMTKSRVMMHESLVVPGDLLNSRKLISTERRLMNTGYFKSVHVRTLDSQPVGFPQANYKDVVIEVEENDSTAKFGIQFGGSVHDGIYGGINATLNNFYLKGLPQFHKKGLEAIRGNGEHLSIESSFSRNWTRYVLSWTDPYFLETPWSFGVDVDNQVQRHNADADKYFTKSKGASVVGFYPLNDFLRFKLSYSLRDEDTILKQPSHSKLLNDQASHSGLYNTFAAALIYDSTNNVIMPTQGFRSSLGGSFTTGPANYLKGFYHNSYYLPVTENTTFKLRADIDLIDGALNTKSEKIPMSQRLFLGGEYNLRGYRYNALGPRDFDTGSSLGGLNMYVYSAEYLYKFNNTFSTFLFQDNGRLGQDLRNWSQTYRSWGWGIRFDIMDKFPLVFGYGYPLAKNKDRSLVRRFFFTIGGRF
jgi:outer membrane protein insertion porin family